MRLALAALLFVIASGPTTAATSRGWPIEQDPVFGFSFSYPKHLFSPSDADEQESFHYFASASHKSKFMVGAWDNADKQTPLELKRWMLENGGYDSVTYEPRGRSWFVVSGYRDEKIFYQKALFSCGGRVVSLFAISYPTAARETFDPVVERMEDTFSAARSCG